MTDQKTCRHVVVLGAQHPTGLTTARSLRNCNVKIIGFFYSKNSYSEKSNIWSNIVHLEETKEDILNKLHEVSNEYKSKILLLPSGDESVKILSDYRAQLPDSCILTLPDQDKVDLLLDKSKFDKWAVENGFPVPKTKIVCNHKELNEAIAFITYPVLIKPLYRNSEWDRQIPSAKVFILERDEDHGTLPKNLFTIAPSMLVQQYIPGNDAGIYFCLVYYNKKGELVDYFCGRKLMQWPPLGGSTALAISDDNDETKNITLSIFDKAKYQGLGSVEYKKNPIDNKMYIMEPTVGRNDFQSFIAVKGNVNLTKMAYLDVIGMQKSVSSKRKSLWLCEMSLYYSLKHYLKRRNYYFVKFIPKIFRNCGCSLFSLNDVKPFYSLFLDKMLK